MEEIYWLKQQQSDLPDHLNWLSTNEQKYLANLRFPRRRDSWILGRWTAKQTLIKYHKQLSIPSDLLLSEIEISKRESGAPNIKFQDEILALSLSLSHCEDVAVAMISNRKKYIGIDIERIAHRDQNFIEDYFTINEQLWIRTADKFNENIKSTMLWSAKESVTKALETGLRISTQSIEILSATEQNGEGWIEFNATVKDAPTDWQGWWRCEDNFILTMAIIIKDRLKALL